MKQKLHYAILEDYIKYNSNINLEDYEETCSVSDKKALEEIREFYNNNLPVDLTAWVRVNSPEDCMLYKNRFSEQVCFVRDILAKLLDIEDNDVTVITTHNSKSITLPVYRLYSKKYNLEIILSDNFYLWSISVNSAEPIDVDFIGLFNEKSSYFYYGFPKDKIYESYSKNKNQFSFHVYSKYNLYSVFYILRH